MRRSEPVLVSIHIPRTGGTSFHWILARHFGPEAVFRSDVADIARVPVPAGARAVHGHFPARTAAGRWPRARTVAWLRDPVERLRSYYRFWREGGRIGSAPARALRGRRPDLLTFARQHRTEVPGYFLGGFQLRRFDFIGVQERYREDATRFGRWARRVLGRPRGAPDTEAWSMAYAGKGGGIPRLNRAGPRRRLSPRTHRALARILRDEIALYREARALRDAQARRERRIRAARQPVRGAISGSRSPAR